jgi:hypothetical protein
MQADIIANVLKYLPFADIDIYLSAFTSLSDKTKESIIKYVHDIRIRKKITDYSVEYRIEYKLWNLYGPARINKKGTCWYVNDKLHNPNGPAVIKPDGTLEYYINGDRHRENGPAVIYPDGSIMYYINNKIHRLDGPAVIEANGTKKYYVNH